jgi:hypothetical protein
MECVAVGWLAGWLMEDEVRVRALQVRDVSSQLTIHTSILNIEE